MLNAKVIGLCAGLAALLAAPLAASAQDAIAPPGQKTIGQPQSAKSDMIPSLAVINSRGATLQGNVLTMTGVGSNSIVFADRPFRAAGHVLTKHFLKEWDEGSDSFAKDPPNATISVLSAEGDAVEDAVVVLKSPKLDGDKLTFEVTVLEGGLSKATGPASLFIDWFAARGYGGRGLSPAATAADGMAPGTAIPIRRGGGSGGASASARRRSERRPPARTTTPTPLSLLGWRPRRRPAATIPIRPATDRHRKHRGDPARHDSSGPEMPSSDKSSAVRRDRAYAVMARGPRADEGAPSSGEALMTTDILTRRAALFSLGAFAAAGLGGCNTTPTAGVQPGAAPPGLRIGAVNVDTRRSSLTWAIRPRAGRNRRCPARSPRRSGRAWRRATPAPCRSTSASTRSISAAAGPPIPTG